MITIAGGGLAGLALGLALRRADVPVTVHEAGSYPRHRVCGEFLSGRGAAVLRDLGMSAALAGAVTHRSTVWFLGGRKIREAALPEPALGLSRFALDRALAEALVEAGGTLVTGSRQRPEPRDGLVWCAGRRPTRGRWIGLKMHVRGLAMAGDLEMHAGRNGYVGLAGIEDGRVNVCGLFRCDPRRPGRLPDYLRAGGLQELAARLERAESVSGSASAVAGFRLGWQPAVPGLLALGDAFGMIPPFSGNGMSMALEAADVARGPVADYARGRMSWDHARRAVGAGLRVRFARRLAAGLVLHPFLTSRLGRGVLAVTAPLRFPPFRVLLSTLRS